MASGADPGADERQKLGAFLRARRGHLDPQVAGLDGAGRRRVPGLRREEVAQLAMISTDYYTRLEQGRIASASESVLDAQANALRLNQDERSYLYRLANKGDQPYPWPRDTERVRPQVRRLLENLRYIPALVLSRFLDILAWNHLATAVVKDFATVLRHERNFLRMLFLDPDFRGRFVDWGPAARAAVGFVRATGPHEPRLAHLISELSLSDAEFRTWWAERHVNYTMAGTRTYTHPATGPYTLDWEMLHIAEDDQILMVMTAPPDTPAQAALRRLGSSQAEIRVDERSGSPIRSTAEHRDGSSSRRSTRQRSAIGQPEPTVH